MDGIDCRKLQEYFNQIPGLIMIDMEGTVFYINDQCARYFQTRKEDFLGKYIKDVFPETKMMENLEIEEPTLVFYNSFLGIGISMHVPLYEDGKKVGLAEYDMVQHSERLYELSDSYKEFLDQELKQLAGELMTFEGTKYTINNLVGTSEPMTELKEKIISTAKTSSTVLITGETGTGKELVAHAIHNLSSRRKERFIKVNASSFPESLIESELFGYERGAFTGANREGRKGKFELADKGTIFLDEIGDLDLSCQVKLLRVLQEQTFEVLGDSRPRKVDIRVVSATNADLSRMVREHTFREDLFYRINLITVHLPALRERREDIPLLVRYFADKQCEANGLPKVDFTVEAMEYLSRLPYPGNIRELKNLVERTLLVSGKQVLMSEDFKAQYQCPVEPKVTSNLQGMTLEEIERQTILQALEKYNNNMSQVATALGISRAALYRRLEKYNIMIND